MNTKTTQTRSTMSGQENYREALRLVAMANTIMHATSLSTEQRLTERAAYLAEAQVHATLAQAAATALANVTEQTIADEYYAWRRVAGSA